MKPFYRPSSGSAPLQSLQKQSGAVLIMSLIILTAITILGITNIESSSLQMKMVNSQRERNVKFAAAEWALAKIQEDIQDADIRKEQLRSDCTGDCFTAQCGNVTDDEDNLVSKTGLCFDGDFTASETELQCDVVKAGANERKVYWQDKDIWNNIPLIEPTISWDGTSLDSENPNAKALRIRGMVEFLCFADPNPDDPAAFDATNPNGGEPNFRFTVLVEDGEGSSAVMLQSTAIVTIKEV